MTNWRDDKTYGVGDLVIYEASVYRSLLADNVGNVPDSDDSDYWTLSPDPFSQVHDALWALLEGSDDFCAMVQPGNRCKFNTANRDPVKAEAVSADFPEVRIIPVSTTPHYHHTSSSSSFVKKWKIEVSTGDQRTNLYLFPLEWVIHKALCQWVTALTSLKWNDTPYVKTVRTTTVGDGVASIDLERGITGWASLWECETELWFATADLLGEDNEHD